MSVLGSQYRKKVEISELEKENKILKRKKEDLDDHVEESDHLYHKIAKLEYMANYSGKNEYNLVKNEYGQMVYQAQLDPNPGSGYLTKSENLVKSESKPDLTKLNLNSEGLATKNIKPVYQEKFQCGPYINNIITTESYSKSKSQNNRYHAQEFIKICENYQSNSNINQVVTFDEANNVLKYLNESPFKVQNEHDLKEEGDKSKENELLNLVSPHIINKLKQCHSATQELLKVFWNLFPINTKEKMSQLLKIKKSLEAYERGPLRQVEERMEGMREEIPASMLSDLKEQIRAATNKYDKYMEFYTGYCKSM